MFFSVIVCCYNSERYFSKGLECLIRQTFRDFEIILIDDGSTDETSLYCDLLAERHNNIKVIHQARAGLGEARNVGIEAATGEYICFFDVDDSVSSVWLDVLYNKVKDKQQQLLIYGYREINIKYNTTANFAFEGKEYKTNHEIRGGYAEHLSGMRFNNGFAWNKVYQRRFLLEYDLRFPNLRIQQDEVFNHNVYLKAARVLVIPEILYDYYIYEKGNTRNSYVFNRLEVFSLVKKSFLHLYETWGLTDVRFLIYIHRRFLNSVIFNRNRKISLGDSIETLKAIVHSEDAKESVNFLMRTDKNFRRQNRLLYNYSKAIEKNSWLRMMLLNTYVDVTTAGRYMVGRMLVWRKR